MENYNTPEAGILLSLGLIPYEITETEGKELFVKVISAGGKTVFTEDAYVAGYDKEGNINYLLHTNERITEEEALNLTETDQFKGDANSRAGFQKIVSKFQNKDAPVKIDGITVREALDADTDFEVKTGELHAFVRRNGELIPVNFFELDYTVSKKLRVPEDIPDFMANKAGVLLEGGDALFVDNAKGYIRLNLAMPRVIVDKGLQRIVKAVKAHQAE